MKTILITGGAGFIGSHLCNRLLNNDYNVICLDNLITSSDKNINHLIKQKNFNFIKADVCTLPDLSKDQIDYIFHLASPASPSIHSKISFINLPYQTMMANSVGTDNVLKLAQQKNSRFLFASTSEIYGDPTIHPQPETYRGNVSTTGPRSVYDESKRFGETITSYYQRHKNVDTRIARIFNTYGPNMSLEDKRVIVNFISQALTNSPITIYGDGSQTRSLCYVSDMVDGLIKLMMTDNLSGEIINLGMPQEMTVKKIAQLVKLTTKSKSNIVYNDKLPTDDPLLRKPDINKAINLLNWQPRIDFQTGLLKTIEYVKSIL